MLTDLRLTLRTLAKSPAFVVLAVLTLGLGIGINSAMFSIVNGVALRALPLPEPHRVMMVYTFNDQSGGQPGNLSQLELDDLRAQQQSFSEVGAYSNRTLILSGPGHTADRLDGTPITAAGLKILAAPIEFGRWFTAEEDRPGATPTMVLGHLAWQNQFQSDPGILGKQIKVNGEWTTIIGVAPADFLFPEATEAFIPFRGLYRESKRDERELTVFARLKPDVTVEQARAEAETFGRRLAADHPDTNKGVRVTAALLRTAFTNDDTRLLLGVMLGAVALVLLIACANVANLLLARAAVREKEIAVRTALGAARGRMVRLLLTESLVLALAGAGLGLALAQLGIVWFRGAVVQLHAPYWMVFELDGPALLYTVGITVATCVVSGLYPALRSSRPDLNIVLKDGGRGSTSAGLGRFTRLMVIGEVVLSCLLLVLSGLMTRTVIKTQSLPLGFQPAGVYLGRVALPDTEYAKDLAKQRQFFTQLRERLMARPEIASVGLADMQPIWTNVGPIMIDGRAPEPEGSSEPQASLVAISPGYLATLNIGLLEGRDFTASDEAAAPHVALVSSAFAQKFWPGQSALGKRFRQGSGKPGEELNWFTVVGIFAPTMQGKFNTTTYPQAFIPFTQNLDAQRMTVFLKARSGDPASLAPLLRQTVSAMHAELPVYFAQTLDQMVAESRAEKKLIAALFGAFGLVALLLAAVGLYGVMSYSVSHRTQEIGVRVALGATPGQVLRLVLWQGGWQLALGLGLGLTLAFFAGKLLGNFLYGVSPTDSVTFVGAFLSLALAGLLATFVPALRAVRVNPIVALRNE